MFGLASFVLVTALATVPAPPPAAPAPPAPDSLMAIPPELDAMLRQRVLRRAHGDDDRLQRLVAMIFAEDGLALQYGSADTHTVAETFATHRANCLSFTMLFVALARRAGIPARAQEVGQVLSWYEAGGLAYNFGHVNAQVRLDGRFGTVDLDRNILMDKRGPRPIDDDRLRAHYYNNRGAELLADGDLDGARAHLEQALQLDPELTDAWNNLGVLDFRQGLLASAASHYAQALARDPHHAATLANSVNLYRRLGDAASVARLLQRLERIHSDDPFHQYLLGTEAERRQDYALAARYYSRAAVLYPAAHQFHFGLARVAFLLGDGRRAERELRRARELGPLDERARYQAKLDSLKRWQAAGGALPAH